jgi:hypothetical protein
MRKMLLTVYKLAFRTDMTSVPGIPIVVYYQERFAELPGQLKEV